MSLWDELHVQGDEPDLETINDVLQKVLSDISNKGGRVYLIFDALDECPGVTNPERATLFSFLVDLLEKHKKNVHILATSRPEEDIRNELEKFPRIDLEAHVAEDVKTFVHTELQRRPLLSRYGGDIKKQIVDALLSSKER